jgi:hypothetical protein
MIMFEDFNYIADENFLEDYWSEEKVTCPTCGGMGKLVVDQQLAAVCPLCRGLKVIKRKVSIQVWGLTKREESAVGIRETTSSSL